MPAKQQMAQPAPAISIAHQAPGQRLPHPHQCHRHIGDADAHAALSAHRHGEQQQRLASGKSRAAGAAAASSNVTVIITAACGCPDQRRDTTVATIAPATKLRDKRARHRLVIAFRGEGHPRGASNCRS